MKVLMDVDEQFQQNYHRKSGSPKDPWIIAHENWQNKWFTSFGSHFTLKIGRFAHPNQTAP
ncbi:hypothetical protein H5410_056488 [Solanum commersonii]|uniref:Uncharacterized protein n=1 Tax=Solanum commersonii TaxID=4109 RepID=A0A9J5WLF8_SOLCO|nr:hypothetical protein H5410_056488 [Solanum commersonii]